MPDTARLELEARCQELVEMAAACPRGGGPTWNSRLEALGVRALPEAERRRHLDHGAAIARGPVPLEVRWALASLCAATPAEDGESILTEALRDYLARVQPRPTTSSIFANAMATTQTYAASRAGAATLTCETCGAPRMHGNEDLRCTYCASERFV